MVPVDKFLPTIEVVDTILGRSQVVPNDAEYWQIHFQKIYFDGKMINRELVEAVNCVDLI